MLCSRYNSLPVLRVWWLQSRSRGWLFPERDLLLRLAGRAGDGTIRRAGLPDHGSRNRCELPRIAHKRFLMLGIVLDASVQWISLMRSVVCLLVLCVANAPAFAQPVARPKNPTPATTGKSAADIQAIKERSESWLKTCLQDWDAATHMTQMEWRTVCRRVTVERENFLIANPETFLMKNSGARPKVNN
jgi:hypothetical protein